jgi:preprotein translocase subunit YajC
MTGNWSILYIIAMFALLYFVLIRPQNKQRKQHSALLTSLKKGDKVVTIGGLHGSIVEISDERVTLKVSDTTRLVFERGAIKGRTSTDEEVPVEKKEQKQEEVKEIKEVKEVVEESK